MAIGSIGTRTESDPVRLASAGVLLVSSAASLLFESSPVPNDSGVFFHGAIQAQIPFGNGFLCTTSGITRGATVQASGNTASYLYDNSDVRNSVAAFIGTIRNFQH